MLLDTAIFRQLYEGLKQELAASGEKRLFIFVSVAEVDSVAALRTLQTLLEKDCVFYTVVHVLTYEDIHQYLEEIYNEDWVDMTTLLLINCGAQEDVVERLDLAKRQARAIVIDSHRPVHANNRSAENRDVIFVRDLADETVDPQEAEEEEEEEMVEEEPSMSAGAAEGGAGPGPALEKQERRPGTRRREEGEAGRKRNREHRQREHAKRKRRLIFERQGPWGYPAAGLVYQLALQLQQHSNHMLWLAILGVTDQHVHERCSEMQYTRYVRDLTVEVEQRRDRLAGTAEHVTTYCDAHGTRISLNRSRIAHALITPEEDFRFPLMRQWSVFESIVHAPYVAVRLQTWHDRGKYRVQELLLYMGLSTTDCKEDYDARSHLFEKLGPKLEKWGVTFGLDSCLYNSFQLRDDSTAGPPHYAADLVLATTALLEAPGQETALDRKATFANAYNALAVRDKGELRLGFKLSRQMQRAVLRDGGMLVMRKGITEKTHFSFSNISKEKVSHKALFMSPQALTRLGLFLRDVTTQRNLVAKPFVIVGPANEQGLCQVLALPAKASAASTQAQLFGECFRAVAEKLRLRIRQFSFDAAVVEIAAADVGAFMRDLIMISLKLFR